MSDSLPRWSSSDLFPRIQSRCSLARAGDFMMRTGFFAYAGVNPAMDECIRKACEIVSTKENKLNFTPWPSLENAGSSIPDSIREKINRTDLFAADITFANENVYYEIGYAIGSGKSIIVFIADFISNELRSHSRYGLFDDIKHLKYSNSNELASFLRTEVGGKLKENHSAPANINQPLFILDTYIKTDFRNIIVSSVKEERLHYRSFDPTEVSRLSALSAIAEISSSSGVIIPYLDTATEDSRAHNIRAAYLIGLAHGYSFPSIVIARSTATPPLDFRNDVITPKTEDDLKIQIREICKMALFKTIERKKSPRGSKRNNLSEINLGAIAAENEFRSLDTYFVETAEYLRVERGEAKLIVGRKGSGKTAIFFMARDSFRNKQKSNIVIDLKPESHQLSSFRQVLTSASNNGVMEHSISAFWQYVILFEIANKISEDARRQVHKSARIIEILNDFNKLHSDDHSHSQGDFTFRLNSLIKYIIDEIDLKQKKSQHIDHGFVTKLLYSSKIPGLRNFIEKTANKNGSIFFLFDNIDKGWSSGGITPDDITITRLLIEALNKTQNLFSPLNIDFKFMLFLRNDVYELLVNQTPDRGKEAEVRIDWNSSDKLKNLTYLRLNNGTLRFSDFSSAWSQYFCSTVRNQDAFEFIVQHSLMRPRFLLDIIQRSISNAQNRGHRIVQEDDIIDGVSQHARYLVDEFGYEIRDVSSIEHDFLYAFLDLDKITSKTAIIERLTNYGIAVEQCTKLFELLLWYGIVGHLDKNNTEKYIYDYEYNQNRMLAKIKTLPTDLRYCINPAIYLGLT